MGFGEIAKRTLIKSEFFQVRHNGAELVANQSVTSRPRFKVDGLAPNTVFTLDVYAINAKGRSTPVRLKTRTRKVHADVKYSFSAGNRYHIFGSAI